MPVFLWCMYHPTTEFCHEKCIKWLVNGLVNKSNSYVVCIDKTQINPHGCKMHHWYWILTSRKKVMEFYNSLHVFFHVHPRLRMNFHGKRITLLMDWLVKWGCLGRFGRMVLIQMFSTFKCIKSLLREWYFCHSLTQSFFKCYFYWIMSQNQECCQ